MLFYIQSFFLFLFITGSDDSRIIVLFFNFLFGLLHLIVYISNFSYYIPKNSFPRIFVNNFPSYNEVFLSLKVFNPDIHNKLENVMLGTAIVNTNRSVVKINCMKMDMFCYEEFPNMNDCNVRELDLGRNKFEELNSYYFPRNLKILNAKFCDLETVNFIHNKLRRIDISNNLITSLELDCNHLEILNISNNRLMDVKLKTPNLKFLDASYNYLENIKVSGLKVLNIKKNNFIVLPNEFLKIKRIYLSGNPIIPNLNAYRWNEYFNIFYPEFFQNNIEMDKNNIYDDQELVHNSYVNNTIKLCLEELYTISKNRKLEDIKFLYKYMDKSRDSLIMNNFRLEELVSVIVSLSKEKGVWNEVKIILEMEMEEGMYYCLSGKVGRIVSSIMGFNLIKNVITISKKDEIRAKYDLVVKRLKGEIGENHPKFYNKLRNEFEIELKIMGVDEREIREWVDEVKN